MTPRVTHVITGLEAGGAEMMLGRLIAALPGWDHRVVSLTTLGPGARALEMLGVPMEALGLRASVPDPRAIVRLARTLRVHEPAVVQTWMYHANVVGGLAARLAGIPNVWSIHHTDLRSSDTKRTTRWVARAGGWLSGTLPYAVVCCAESACRVHVEHGYADERMVVIPNGFDTRQFRPEPAARNRVRRELDIPEDAVVAGHFGRFHPIKDHRTLLEGFALAAHAHPSAVLVCAGAGVEWATPELAAWIGELGLRERVRLVGRRDDVAAIQAAIDIGCLSSTAEAFPLAVGESMASGAPCVVTGVGDAAAMVGATGWVVPPGDATAFGAALGEAFALPATTRRERGLAARSRIAERWTLERMAARYDTLWREAAQGLARTRASDERREAVSA